MLFSVDKMFILPDAGSVKGFVDVTIADMLVIRGVRIIDGEKGLYVSMPQEQGKDNKWYDQVICKNAEVYAELSAVVLGEYGERISKMYSVPEITGWSTH